MENTISYSKQYRIQNRDRLNEETRKRYWKNPLKSRERLKKWYSRNKEKLREYRVRNRAKRAEYIKEYNKKHSQERKLYLRNWRLNNPEKYRASVLKSRKNHQEAYKLRNRLGQAKRAALLRKASLNLRGIKSFIKNMMSKEFVFCYYCGEKIYPNYVHFDHIIPLIKGGMHSVDNLCVSCSRCNLSKNSKLISDWIKTGQLIFNI